MCSANCLKMDQLRRHFHSNEDDLAIDDAVAAVDREEVEAVN